MTSSTTGSRTARFAGAVLLALFLVAPGCGRPPDETWLRVVQFEDDGENVISALSSIVQTITTTTTTDTTDTTITTTDTTTELGSTDYVDVVLANQSTVVGTSGQAGGVTVDQVRITYAIAGYSPPGATYAVSLYVPVSSVDGTTTNVRLSVALVSTALKSWLAETVPESVLSGGLHASALLEFHARTDQGDEIETEAGISIIFENETVSIDG